MKRWSSEIGASLLETIWNEERHLGKHFAHRMYYGKVRHRKTKHKIFVKLGKHVLEIAKRHSLFRGTGYYGELWSPKSWADTAHKEIENEIHENFLQ